jgi:hypothetical protein
MPDSQQSDVQEGQGVLSKKGFVWGISSAADLVSLISNVGVVVTVALGVITYLDQIKQLERNAAFEFSTRLNQGDLLSIQRRLSVELSKLQLGQFEGIALQRSTIAAMVEKLAETTKDQSLFEQDVITLISYFDEAQTCIEAGTCDPETLHKSIGEPAGRYACLFLPYTSNLRDRYLLEGLGSGLARMIEYEKTC